MSSPSPNTLYYVHDPMCSWCWGFRHTWEQIKLQLPEDLQLVQWVGGLAPDSDEPMPEKMQSYLQDTWKRIQQIIPGTEFNFDFWSKNTARRSTYPACRAVIAAGELSNLDEEMTSGIQQAYYLQAKNPSDLETLIDIAGAIGLDTEQFEQKMTSPDIHQSLATELSKVQSIGVNSFPSLVIQQGLRIQTIALDYNSAENMLRDIHHFLQHDNS